METLLAKVGEANPALALVTQTKRLLFESQTMALSHLKSVVGQKPESIARHMPGAERHQRMTCQANRLAGIEIKNDLEPAHSVYDAIATMVEHNSIKYLRPSRIPTRQQELQTKGTKELALDTSGANLTITEKASSAQAKLGTEMATYPAMQRRSLAFDLVGVLSYKVHEKWLQKAFSRLQDPAIPGYAPVYLAQVLRAQSPLKPCGMAKVPSRKSSPDLSNGGKDEEKARTRAVRRPVEAKTIGAKRMVAAGTNGQALPPLRMMTRRFWKAMAELDLLKPQCQSMVLRWIRSPGVDNTTFWHQFEGARAARIPEFNPA